MGRAPSSKSAYRFDLDGFEYCWQRDLDELEVLGVCNFVVFDSGRLMHAASRLGAHATDAFVVEIDPATDHVEHLKVELVEVCASHSRRARFRADHVGKHL